MKKEAAIAALADRVGNIEAEYVNSEQFAVLVATVNRLLDDMKRADAQIQTNILVAQEALKRASGGSAPLSLASERIMRDREFKHRFLGMFGEPFGVTVMASLSVQWDDLWAEVYGEEFEDDD